ncbi:YIP1 family protein [Bacillus sp. JCM 19041]|uniref:YIP1 family protein n=1 Tax=Bacillus sp. JCM 19041 TaxID=1460637 RepID=UPI0006CFE983
MNSSNPWLAIWISPRSVMKDALAHGLHRKASIILSFLFGALITLWFARTELLVLAAEGSILPLLITVIVGSLTGPILFYGFGFALGHVGSWYGGNGDIEATRKVYVYAFFMPGIIVGLQNLLLFGLALMQVQFLQSSLMDIIITIGSFIVNVASIWLIVIFLIAFAEAQQITIWRSLLIIIAFLGCLALLYIVVDIVTSFVR